MAFIEISKLQFTESGNLIVGDQHIHFHVDPKTFKEIVGKPELEQTVLNSTMAKLKPQENQLKSLPEDNLNQKVIMSTIESTAEALKMPAFRLEASGTTHDGGEAVVPSTTVAGTRSTGPPDDKADITIKVHDVVMATEVTHVEPMIEVSATPTGKDPIVSEYPITSASATISGATVPLVTDNPAETIPFVNEFIDLVKENYDPSEHEIVIKYSEKEKEDKGWFSHFDMDFGGFDLDKGFWGLKIKEGTPKKIEKTKETTVRIRLEEKEK